MAKYTAEVRYLASIWPGRLDPIKLYHGPSPNTKSKRATDYVLTPIARNKKPCVIEVADAFENVFNPMSAGQGDKWVSKPVDAKEIVDNLLKVWAGNIIGAPENSGPGIMEIIGTIPQKKELDEMLDRQTIFAEYMFQQGELHHRQNQWKEITQTMRDCGTWLMKKSLWIDPASTGKEINCPACGELISPEVAICRHCSTRLKALPAEIEALNAGRQIGRPTEVLA